MPVDLKWLTNNYGIALSCSSTKVTFLKERHSSIILSDFDATFDTCNLASSRLISMLVKANVCDMHGELMTDCAVTLKNDISAARPRRSFSYCPKARSPRCCHRSVDVRPCPASRRRKTKRRSRLNCQWVNRKRPNEVAVRRHSSSLSLPTPMDKSKCA